MKLRAKLGLAALACVFGVSSGAWGWYRLRPYPPVGAGDAARGEWALTNSDLGSSLYGSVPRPVWEAIPVLFPDRLPEGWAGIGLPTRPEDPTGPPMGMTRASLAGMEMYAANCAICHVGRVEGKLVPGAPNTDFDIQYFMWLLGDVLRSNTLTFEAVEKTARDLGRPLGMAEGLRVRGWIAVAKRSAQSKPSRPFVSTTGPGRSDNLNGFKRMFGLPDNEHTGAVELVGLFNQSVKVRKLVDGSITGDSASQVMLSELQKGRSARDALLHREVFDDIIAYLRTSLRPPKFAHPIDAAAAARGHLVFKDACADCHGTYAPDPLSYPNEQVAVSEVGTDPERALSMSKGLAEVLERTEFRSYIRIQPVEAYLPPPLGGVWLTAPYLHNGSVPTLWHLLHPDQRPVAFYRRWNDFDPERVGLVCRERTTPKGTECEPDATQATHNPLTLSFFDTTAKGNSNAGHTYGDELSEPEKADLLEYLKTL